MARATKQPDATPADAFLTGQLLIAMPAMGDPRFAQSVIYLCAHTSDGAMGIVVNRPLQKPSFEDLLRQLEVAPTPPARAIQLCQGGPVDNARGFVLHTSDWTGQPGRAEGDRRGRGPARRIAGVGICRLGAGAAR
jgi:putative transcriptional regulator